MLALPFYPHTYVHQSLMKKKKKKKTDWNKGTLLVRKNQTSNPYFLCYGVLSISNNNSHPFIEHLLMLITGCISQSSSEKQNQWHIFISRKVFVNKVSAHAVMEAEKSHHLLSASWRLVSRKAGGIAWRPESQGCRFQPESEGLSTSSTKGRRYPRSSSQAETGCILPFLTFCSI